MCYGLTAEVKNNEVYFTAYNDYPDEFDLKIKALDLISDSNVTILKLSDKIQSIVCPNTTTAYMPSEQLSQAIKSL